MWGISGVCTLALTVAKTIPHYDRFAFVVPARSLLLFDLALQDGNISGPKGPRGTRGNGDISEARFMLCIIPTIMVLSFFFNSRILKTGNLQSGILQTGPNQFVENQENTIRFGMENLPKRLDLFFCRNVFAETSLPKRLCRNVFAETSCSRSKYLVVSTS